MDRGAVLLLGGSGSGYMVDKETCCWWKYLNWGLSAGGIRVRVPDAQRNGCCFRDLNGMVGPDDLDGLFQPRRFCDSVRLGAQIRTRCARAAPRGSQGTAVVTLLPDGEHTKSGQPQPPASPQPRPALLPGRFLLPVPHLPEGRAGGGAAERRAMAA